MSHYHPSILILYPFGNQIKWEEYAWIMGCQDYY